MYGKTSRIIRGDVPGHASQCTQCTQCSNVLRCSSIAYALIA
ncbi:MAG: hypothetical protein ACPK85_06020 [Methanosarcina sp.]